MCKFKASIALFLSALIVFLTVGCAPEYSQSSFTALDTIINTTVYGNEAEKAVSAVKECIINYENTFSVTSPKSDVYKINSEKNTEVTHETAQLISKAIECSSATSGLFDITVYPAVKAWGFTGDTYRIPTASELSALTEAIDYHTISLKNNHIAIPDNTQLDLGGCAKGYIGDKISELLSDFNISGAVISLGGNIITYGQKPKDNTFNVGIEYPYSGDYYAVLSVTNTNIISSGAYQRNFTGEDGKTYHHIIDPRTASPAESDLKEVTIISPDGTKADCYSTALYVMGLEQAKNFCKQNSGFDAVLLANDDTVYITKGISDSFELSQNYSHLTVEIIS